MFIAERLASFELEIDMILHIAQEQLLFNEDARMWSSIPCPQSPRSLRQDELNGTKRWWTVEENMTFRRMWREGQTTIAMAQTFGITQSQVHHKKSTMRKADKVRREEGERSMILDLD